MCLSIHSSFYLSSTYVQSINNIHLSNFHQPICPFITVSQNCSPFFSSALLYRLICISKLIINCMFIHPPTHPAIHQPIHPSIHAMHRSAYCFIQLSLCLSFTASVINMFWQTCVFFKHNHC